MSEIINDENLEKTGKINMLGVNLDIAATMGGILAEQYFAQIPETTIQELYDHISSDLFTKSMYEPHNLRVKTSKNNWNDKILADRLKDTFNSMAKDRIAEKCDELLKSEKYTKMIDEIAEEVVEYTVNGYREDLKNRVKERLVNNVTSEYPWYGGMNLIDIINQELDKKLFNQ